MTMKVSINAYWEFAVDLPARWITLPKIFHFILDFTRRWLHTNNNSILDRFDLNLSTEYIFLLIINLFWLSPASSYDITLLLDPQ